MPVQTSLCAILKQPEVYSGKLVRFRATVEPGVYDLPAGVSDASCSAELKLFTPDDSHLAGLLKSKEFRKLTKCLPKKPEVQATLTGWFKLGTAPASPGPPPGSGLLLESVADVVARNAAKVHLPAGSQRRM